MKPRTLRRRLAALIAIRLVVATVLLGSAVVVQLRQPDVWSINPFAFLIGLTYALSLAFIGSLRFLDRFPWLIDVHFSIDAILVSAGGPTIPDALLEQLAIGGRLVIPVGRETRRQHLLRVTRRDGGAFAEEDLGEVAFVPLIGEQGWPEDERGEPRRR